MIKLFFMEWLYCQQISFILVARRLNCSCIYYSKRENWVFFILGFFT
uniref:Uncharacterized protein n=1 Tax=Anguilla anguilla TaxID=7936 RepID=A0A0E9X8C0_ANGAN